MNTYRLCIQIWFANGLKEKICDVVVQLQHGLRTKAGAAELEAVVWEYYHQGLGLWPNTRSMKILEQKVCKPVKGHENEPLVWFADTKEWLKS